MSATAKVGRNARIYVGSTVVGFVRNITGGASAEAVKDYSMDQAAPAILGSGNQTFTWSAEMLYSENSVFLSKLLAGTTFTLGFFSNTTPGVAPYETWTGCVVLKWDKKAGMTGGIVSSVSGEAILVTPTAS
jgi:hypothetical protein